MLFGRTRCADLLELDNLHELRARVSLQRFRTGSRGGYVTSGLDQTCGSMLAPADKANKVGVCRDLQPQGTCSDYEAIMVILLRA